MKSFFNGSHLQHINKHYINSSSTMKGLFNNCKSYDAGVEYSKKNDLLFSQ